ncbi:MAG: LamG domain-containing protein [Candidatus Poribacteria bacterium]
MKSCLILTVLALFVFTTVSFAALEEGLVSAWTFDDGTARDAGGGGNHGIIKGNVKSVAGKIGKAMDFDGAKGSYIEVPDSPSLQQDVFTISAWINVRKGVDHAAIFFKGEKIGWGANFMARIATTSDTGLTWGTTSGGSENWFATDGVITANKWYHVCLKADGKQATAYVDAKKPASGQANPQTAPAPLNKFPGKPVEIGVGRAYGGTVGDDRYYNGLIDQMYFWKRALSDAEVTQLAGGAVLTAVEARNKLSTTWANIKAY